MPDAYVEIGRVKSVNPARREVRITPRAGYAAAFDKLNWLTTQGSGSGPARARLDRIETRGPDVVATLGAVVSRDSVAGMHRARVLLAESDAPDPDVFAMDPGDLKGCAVVDESGRTLGVVAGGFAARDNRVIEIERAGSASRIAPLIPGLVVALDWSGRRLVVRDLDRHAVEHDSGSRMA